MMRPGRFWPGATWLTGPDCAALGQPIEFLALLLARPVTGRATLKKLLRLVVAGGGVPAVLLRLRQILVQVCNLPIGVAELPLRGAQGLVGGEVLREHRALLLQ